MVSHFALRGAGLALERAHKQAKDIKDENTKKAIEELETAMKELIAAFAS